jgi:hypothetical protein
LKVLSPTAGRLYILYKAIIPGLILQGTLNDENSREHNSTSITEQKKKIPDQTCGEQETEIRVSWYWQSEEEQQITNDISAPSFRATQKKFAVYFFFISSIV